MAAAPPEKWFSLFGLVVVRRTDLLAAAAFALSLSTISYQAWQFLRGANPLMYHPDTLYVFFERYANGVSATRLAGQMSFTNDGETGHNAVIRNVSAAISLGPKTIEESWQSFATITRRDTELAIGVKETAHPFVIEGGSSSSYMTTFAPTVTDCAASTGERVACNQSVNFVSDIDFLKLLSQERSGTVTFTGSLFGSSRKLETHCSVSITDDVFHTMAKNDWYALLCSSSP